MANNNELIYIEKQIKEINRWEKHEPSVVEVGLSKLFSPISSISSVVIPSAVIEKAIEYAQKAGGMLAGKEDILKDGKVNFIGELKLKDLALSDKLADSVHNWAIGMAGAEGMATGFGGTVTIAADIPAVITLAFRTIHKIAMCYGYEVNNDQEREFVLNILSVSGANTLKERKLAISILQREFIQKQMVKNLVMSDLVKKIAKQLGVNLAKRKALQLAPFIGAGVGAAVNASYIRDIAWDARRAYQRRWLEDNGYRNINVEI